MASSQNCGSMGSNLARSFKIEKMAFSTARSNPWDDEWYCSVCRCPATEREKHAPVQPTTFCSVRRRGTFGFLFFVCARNLSTLSVISKHTMSFLFVILVCHSFCWLIILLCSTVCMVVSVIFQGPNHSDLYLLLFPTRPYNCSLFQNKKFWPIVFG